MALAVRGKVTVGGNGRHGLRIHLEEVDSFCDDMRVAETVTGVDGTFDFGNVFSALTGPLHLRERTVELRVHIYDGVYRRLHRSAIRKSSTGENQTLAFPNIELSLGDVDGIVVTGPETYDFPVRKAVVTPLIDNEEAWGALYDDLRTARSKVNANLFYFDVTDKPGDTQFSVARFDARTDPPAMLTIDDALLEAVKNGTDVRINIRSIWWWHVLTIAPLAMIALSVLFFALFVFISQSSSVLGIIFTAVSAIVSISLLMIAIIILQVGRSSAYTGAQVIDWIEQASTEIAGSHSGSLAGRRYGDYLRYPLHAKFMTIDGHTGHLIGSPLLQEYFDASGGNDVPPHRIDDPRRGVLTDLNSIKVPIHDVGAKVVGPVVQDLDQTFELLWNDKADDMVPAAGTATWPGTEPATSSMDSVQVVRSLPSNRYPSKPNGEATILEAYLRAIALAESYVYIENQYITEPAILIALAERMEARSDLQVIFLINNAVDIPGYGSWQPGLLAEFYQRIGSNADRVEIFNIWSHERVANGGFHDRGRIVRNYVHSKVCIVDDRWMTVGSANLDAVSLSESQLADERLRVALDDPLEESTGGDRAVEVNLTAFAEPFPSGTCRSAVDLRKRLWSEHLGLPVDALDNPPDDGWLALWKERADDKLSDLKARPDTPHEARVLIDRGALVSTSKDPKVHLRRMMSEEELSRLETLEAVPSHDISAWPRPTNG